MLLAGGPNRLLLLAVGIFVVILVSLLVRPGSLDTWPANGPVGIDEDYLAKQGLTAPNNGQEESPGRFKSAPTKSEPVDSSDDIPLHFQPVEGTTIPLVPGTGESSAPVRQFPHVTTSSHAQATSTTSQEEGFLQDGPALEGYNEIFSQMTPDKKWFPIDFGDYGSYNPNLLPHPYKNDTFVMIAQGAQTAGEAAGPVYSIELVCDATYRDGKMQCLRSPTTVPIASTVSDHCTGDLEWFNYFIGPNDPRVFFGPDRPYITYGSASQYTCLGQWIHDLRRLVRWNDMQALDRNQRFFWATELQRPAPYGNVEKNWFAFWDAAGDMYLHYDIYPKRAFAKLSADGQKISEDLAHTAASADGECLQKYMPVLKDKEHIHQATNSLSVTMCKRGEKACDAKETYIFTIFHHKQYHGHNLYEPYIMMIKNTAPFGIHAISAKPFWINGRGRAGSGDPNRPADQSQMMYITSMAWKAQNMTYHGYLDDEILVNFGVEDKSAGAIDVVAGDLLRELNLCS